MSFPVVVEVTRSGVVESFSTGSWCLCDPDGKVVWIGGDIERPVYIRSCSKLFQTLPIIESGTADRFNLTDAELAVITSSHNAEPLHVQAVRGILAKGGLTESALLCGPQAPYSKDAMNELIKNGEPFKPIHNNCSGKHAGMLLLALHLGFSTEGYNLPDHPVQKLSIQAYSRMAMVKESEIGIGWDGCDVPAFVTTLRAAARAAARFAYPSSIKDESLACAVERLGKALVANPFMIAGTNRFCTALAIAGKGAIIGKTGAEAGYIAPIFKHRLGFASKINDGGYRASYAFLPQVFHKMGLFAEPLAEEIKPFLAAEERNTVGRLVGRIEVPSAILNSIPRLGGC